MSSSQKQPAGRTFYPNIGPIKPREYAATKEATYQKSMPQQPPLQKFKSAEPDHNDFDRSSEKCKGCLELENRVSVLEQQILKFQVTLSEIKAV